ncbi:TonB-dependent receptor plug domain-containing protein [Paraflavitalea speifideaquila]|uniref:TonB-dependent receptor plug domain-containing protein n=1 Tax=Paraflavitalea speifideaquila TaxID=3076558 RepID=UPI0028EDAF5D|nr:TonB-dependent receptor plug domain-containing protein [Paraflavitalea speifideiaquila]
MNNDEVIIVSGISIETLEVKILEARNLNLVVKRKETSLQEVIIRKGYYDEKRKFSASNVGQVTGKEIERQPVNNPLLALQGRVPGLVVTQTTGLPGGGITVKIQGQNSIGNSNDPLFIIDGVPYASQMLPTTVGGPLGSSSTGGGGSNPAGGGNPLSFINPNDIESIEILKDADATSIYGSRAANGAILITLKKGKSGRTKLEINLRNGWAKVTKRLDLLDNKQYLQMRREALVNDNGSISSTDYDLNGFWDTTQNTDWQKN